MAEIRWHSSWSAAEADAEEHFRNPDGGNLGGGDTRARTTAIRRAVPYGLLVVRRLLPEVAALRHGVPVRARPIDDLSRQRRRDALLDLPALRCLVGQRSARISERRRAHGDLRRRRAGTPSLAGGQCVSRRPADD